MTPVETPSPAGIALTKSLLLVELPMVPRTGIVIRQRRVAPLVPTCALTIVIEVAPMTRAGLKVPLVPPPLVTQSIVGGVAVMSPTDVALPPERKGKESVILLMVSGTLELAFVISIVRTLS